MAASHSKPATSTRFFACAAVVAAVAGWALALFMIGQYRAERRERQAALERLTEIEAARTQPAAPETPDRRVAVGRLIETRGLVLATLKGEAKAIPVVAEYPIPMGGSLWTCPWGGAAMRFADGASMDLERSTEVVISESGNDPSRGNQEGHSSWPTTWTAPRKAQSSSPPPRPL